MDKPVKLYINLLPPPKRFKVNRTAGSIILIIALLGILSASVFIIQEREINRGESENTRLQAILDNYEKEIIPFEPLQAVEQDITQKGEQISAIEKNRLSHLSAINEVDKARPETVTIVTVEIRSAKVVLNGFSPDHLTVSRMLDYLKASSLFNEVTLLTSELNEETNEVHFILEIEREAGQK